MGTALSSQNFKLQTLYINVRRLVELAGEVAVSSAMSGFFGPAEDRGLQNARLGACGRVLRSWLIANSTKIKPLEELLITGTIQPGSIFTTEHYFHCANLVPRVRPTKAPSNLHTKYQTAEGTVELTLQTHSDHLLPGSPAYELSGTVKDLFVVGTIKSSTGNSIEASTIFIGRRIDPVSDAILAHQLEVHAEQIDNFALCSGQEARSRDLPILKNISETEIKRALASILQEDSIPKDWGGERSDFFTTNLTIGDQPHSSAFLLKGPAKFHPMKAKDLGKNGDQIDRLFSEPAQLLVLQHCHDVTAGVRNTMKAYAMRVGDLRKYCIIDGATTLRILRAYSLCGLTPKPRRERLPEAELE